MVHFERSVLLGFAVRGGFWGAAVIMALIFLSGHVIAAGIFGACVLIFGWGGLLLFQPALYAWTRRDPVLMAERAAAGLSPVDPSPLPFSRPQSRPQSPAVTGPTIRLSNDETPAARRIVELMERRIGGR